MKALTWMVDLINDGYSPATAADGAWNSLIAGESAISWNGVWMASDPALAEITWSTSPLPQIGDQQAVWSSSTHWVFPQNSGQDSNKTAAAVTFVNWMNEHSMDWSGVELPAVNEIRNSPELVEAHPQAQPFLDELEYAHFETTAPGITTITPILLTEVSNALLLKKSPQEALDAAAEKANQQLEQNAKQYGG